MIILFVFVVFALFFGLGFALNWLWFVATIFLLFWFFGVMLGRREPIGRHRFYRW
jgi:hypothetical protein